MGREGHGPRRGDDDGDSEEGHPAQRHGDARAIVTHDERPAPEPQRPGQRPASRRLGDVEALHQLQRPHAGEHADGQQQRAAAAAAEVHGQHEQPDAGRQHERMGGQQQPGGQDAVQQREPPAEGWRQRRDDVHGADDRRRRAGRGWQPRRAHARSQAQGAAVHAEAPARRVTPSRDQVRVVLDDQPGADRRQRGGCDERVQGDCQPAADEDEQTGLPLVQAPSGEVHPGAERVPLEADHRAASRASGGPADTRRRRSARHARPATPATDAAITRALKAPAAAGPANAANPATTVAHVMAPATL